MDKVFLLMPLENFLSTYFYYRKRKTAIIPYYRSVYTFILSRLCSESITIPLEELIFRLLPIYISLNAYIAALLFGLFHFGVGKPGIENYHHMLRTAILGWMMYHIALEHGIGYTILLHFYYNISYYLFVYYLNRKIMTTPIFFFRK